MYPSPCPRLLMTFGTLTLKEKDEIETKFDKGLNVYLKRHSELFNVSSIQLARRLLEEALLPKTSVRHSRISWKARILYQDLFTDPSLHNQGRRRISWRRWLRQVSGGRHLEKTKWGQSETSWGARSPHDADRSSSIFRDQKKNSGISKGHCHKDYQERHTTRSF